MGMVVVPKNGPDHQKVAIGSWYLSTRWHPVNGTDIIILEPKQHSLSCAKIRCTLTCYTVALELLTTQLSQSQQIWHLSQGTGANWQLILPRK